ncbi:MAG: gliding motility-associated C-terminal protein [Mucilaginibacter sp.]|nr:gliding motility-associated C-terminal protein [Mucilaginibacter sp.]
MKTFTFYSRYIIVLCLLLCATSKIFGQRHFATTQNNGATGLLCVGCTVTNPLNAVDANLQTYSVLNVPVSLLAGTYQELIFPGGAVAANTPLTIKLGTGDNLLDVTALGGVIITPYNGNVAGTSITAPTLASVLSNNNQVELIFSPTTAYDRVRVTLNGGLLGALSSIYLYDAFYTTPGGAPICNTPYDELHGISSALLGLGLSVGGVVNPQNAIDADINTASTLNAGVGALGAYAQQTIVFENSSIIGDSVRITVSLPKAILDVGVLTNSTISTFNGNTDNNDTQQLNGSLLRLRLLDLTANRQRLTITYAPTKVFDRVQLRLGGIASVLSTLDFYGAELVIPKPVVKINSIASDTTQVCAGSGLTLVASANAPATFNWYTTATGGTSVHTGASFPVTNINANITYYVSATRAGCPTASNRAAITINVNQIPAAPVVPVATQPACPGSSAIFAATPVAGVTVNWYTAATGGTLVYSGNTFTTPTLTAATNYYAEATVGGVCVSATRTPVHAIINAAPAVPTVDPKTICDGSVAVLSIGSPVATQTYNWYDAATGGNLLKTGQDFTSPPLNASTTYYAEAVNATGCVSTTRVAVPVTVQPIPANPVVAATNATIAAGQTATINVTNAQTGITYKWYNSATAVTPIFTSTTPTFVTPALFGSTTYYVAAESTAGGCQSASRTSITISVTVDSNSPCTFANKQTKSIDGVCLLCDVTTPELAVDADTTTASTFVVPVGLLGGSASQILQFQQAGFAGDTIRLVLQSPGGLADLSLLGGITVTVLNGTTTVGSYPLNSSLLTLRLLGGTGRYAVYIPATGNYDRIKITLSVGAATLLTSLNVYYAVQQYSKPTFDPTALNICKGSPAHLSITSPNPANGTFSWFTTPTGGTAVGTGLTYTTPALAANTTYYVEYSRGTCVSPVRTPAQVIVNDIPVKPAVTPSPANINAGQTATLQATVVNNATIKWYDAATGGTLVHTGPTFTTPVLNATTTYYAEASLGSCVSPDRTAVPVNVTAIVIPDVSVSPATQAVDAGTSATIVATSTVPGTGTIFNWYTTPTGGTPVYTGATFVTPPVFADITYYAEAVVTATGAKSANRAPAAVNVNAIGSDPVACDAAIDQTSSVNGVCLLCGISNAGGAVDNNRNTFSQIHVPIALLGGTGQQTLRFANAGIVGDSIIVELGIPGSLADVGVLSQIQLSTYSGTTFNNDILSVNGSLLNITLLNGTNRFRVAFKATHNFDRVQIAFNSGVAGLLNTVNVYDATIAVAAPTIAVANVTQCPGPVTLTATVSGDATVKWYTTATGGSPVFTGSSYLINAPAIGTTIYYAEATRTGTGCAQKVRTPATVTISPVPAAPIITSDPTPTVCPGGKATITAQAASGATINWYAAAAGGQPLFTGPAFTTPALTAETSYYAEAVAGGTCISAARTPIKVSISALPAVPTLVANPPICDGDVAVLAIANPVTGQTYNWYTAATGGSPIATGINFTSPTALHTTTPFYAEAVNGTGCASSTRFEAIVTVNPKPADPILATNSTTVSAGQTAIINVTNAQTGITYNWYTTATGPTPVATGPSFTTPPLLSTTTYYAEAVNSTGCKSARTPITINVTIDNNSPCTFANQQTKTVTGICALCDVTNGALAVDADTTTASTLVVPVALLNAGVSQTLQFQQPGFAGDIIKLSLQTPVSLADVSLLGSITVGVYNGTTEVATYPLSSSLLTLKLLGAGNRYAVYVPATAAYDRVVVTLKSGAATLLTSLNVFYAIQQYPSPVFDPVAPEVCKGSTATINITTPSPANGTFTWFTTPTGGSSVGTGTPFTTPPLTANTTYYVEYSRGSCISPVRKAVQVIVDDAPVKPVVTPPSAAITAGQTATFTATVPNNPNATINWYTSPTGGTLVGTGSPFTTPVLTTTTTYYAESALGSCVSPDRTAVIITVTPVVIPDVAVNPATQPINAGTTATMVASSSTTGAGTIVYDWFTTPTGGTSIYTGATFTTPSLFAGTTYYAEATITATGVKSTTRAPGAVTINAIGTGPVPCDAAIAQTSAVNGICLVCGTNNDADAVDNNSESFSQLHIPVGLVGASVQQTLRFANTGIAGDSVIIDLGIPGSLLDLSILSQIQITTYNGTVSNGDQFTVNGSLLTLTVLNGTSRFKVAFKAAHTFDRVQIVLGGGLASALTALNIYDAYQTVTTPTVNAAGTTVCQGSPATLTITGTPPANVTIKWYDAATGGNLVGTGPSVVVNAVTATKTYYAEASRTASGCAQATRAPFKVNVTSAPAAPVAADKPVCSGQSVVLTAVPVAGITYNWYDAATGGTLLLANNASYPTPALTATTTYYVEAVAGTCASATRTPVKAIVTAAPSVPVVIPPAAICSGSPATLSVTPVAGVTYNWYTAATGGTLAFTGNPVSTPALTANTTYYVEAVLTGGCTSSTRAPAAVSVNPTPAAPTITIVPANGQVTSGQTATLTATSTGATINWYASATGGTPVGSGSPFTTPPLTSTTTYYAEAVSSTGGCINATRTPIQITVNPVFSTSCDFASSQTFDKNNGLLCVGCAVNNPDNAVDQDTTNFSQLNLPIGLVGSYLSQQLIFSDAGAIGDTVTVKLRIPGTLISVGLLNQLQIASYNGATFNNDRINLSSSLLKLTILAGGETALVKFAPQTAFDRVEIKLNGALAAVFSTVNIYYASKQVEKPTFAPNANAVSICAGNKASFAINNARAGVTYKWYTSSTGGASIFTGPNFTSPTVLTATTVFYVESSRASSGCPNPNRVPATANVTPGPGNPTLVNPLLPVCSGLTATFNVSPVQPGVVYNWFATATGGTSIATGPDFTTPPLTVDATYYVEASSTGCTSPARTLARATVTPTPAAPTVTVSPVGGIITAGGTATLTVNPTTAGVTYNWYTQPTGGTAIQAGPSITVQPNVTTTYYAEASVASGCVSPQRTSVLITVNQPVVVPDVIVNPATQPINAGTTATMVASSSTTGVGTIVYDWFTTPTGGTSIYTGATFTTPSLFAGTTYYAEATITATGVKSTTRAPGAVTINAIGTGPVPCDAAIDQTHSSNGLCVLCGTTNDVAAVDNNSESFSQIHIPVGLLNGTSQQTLRFANAGIAGDSIVVDLGVPGSLLDLSVLSQIQLATYNGTTYNGDRFTVSSSLLHLTVLNGTTRFRVPFKAGSAFDRVEITFNGGLATALSALNVYDAYQSVASPTVSATGPIVCQGAATTLSISGTPISNVTYKWYAAATGGSALATGPTYPIGAVNATTTYYVEASRSSSGCPQAVRTPVTVTVTPAPVAPVVAVPNPSVCSGQPATFTATAVAGVTFNWYTTPTGGTPVFTGNPFTTTALTPTYYVEATAGACGSSTRTPVKATVTTTPVVPVTATAAPICSGTSTTVSVASPVTGVTYNWYDAATGGTLLLANSASYPTPVLTATTTYYVEAVAGSCTSPTRGTATVTVNPTPVAPTVTTNPANGQVTSGQTATLTVSPTTPGITYNWYNLPTGGTILKTDPSFTTPVLTSTTTFYVEAVSASGCSSTARTAVKITVNPIFSTNCDFASSQTFDVSGVCLLCDVTSPNNSVDQDTTNFSELHMPVSALGSYVNQKLIFSDPGVVGDTVTIKLSIPASLTDISILNSIQLASYNGTTYNGDRVTLSSSLLKITLLSGGQTAIVKFAPQAGFDRVEVRLNSGVATLFTDLNLYYASKQVEAPILLTKNPAPICVGGTTTLAVANGRAGITYKWYTVAVGGTPVFTGTSFPVTGLTTTTTFYVESSRTSTGCANPNRVSVPVNVIPTPATPTLDKLTATICAGDPPVVFIVTNAQTGVTYNWYDAGGILVHTGTSFSSSPISTITYSIEAVNGTSCTSTARATATITVNPVPSNPGVASPNATACAGSSAPLAVLNPEAGVTYNWYTQATGGTSVHTGTTFQTPAITQIVTYYIEATNASGCTNTGGRTSITVTPTTLPIAPTLSASQNQVCNGGSVTITITNPVAGVTYNWYTVATGGTAVFTNTSTNPAYTTPALTADVSYYVEAVVSGCSSATRTQIDIKVLAVPTPPIVQTPAGGNSVCFGFPATLTITNPQSGVIYNWYDVATGGTPVFTSTSPIYQTPALTVSTTYYVEATMAGNCNASARTAVPVTVNPLPIDPVLTDAAPSACLGSPAVLAIKTPQTGVVYNWYTTANGTTPAQANSITYTTPPITAATEFYVEAISGNGCGNASGRIKIVVNVTTPPAAPVIANGATTPTCTGSEATLTIQNPQVILTYRWYDAATGGTLLASGIEYKTPVLTADASYYAEAVNGAGCTSSSRTRVDVKVNQLPNGPTVTAQGGSLAICAGSPAVLTASSSTPGVTISTYNWYTTATGGTPVFSGATFNTPPVTAAITYYVEAVSDAGCASSVRTPVPLTIDNTKAPDPTVDAAGLTTCQNSATTINIQNPVAGTTYNWYADATGGTAIFTGSSFHTPVLTANTTYYVEAVNAQNCSASTRVAAPVVITSPPTTPTLTLTAAPVCRGSSTTLHVSSPQSGITYNWYADAGRTNLVYTGTDFPTGPVNADITYYVEAASGSCTSASLASVKVTAIDAPAVPVVANSGGINSCQGGTATLNVSNPQSNLIYKWYSTASGGTAVFTGPSFITPVLTTNTIYYVEAINATGCPSASRANATVTVTGAPVAPQASTDGTSICPGVSTTVSATSATPGAIINWYADAAGGAILATGTSFTTPVLTANTTYYAEATTAGGCVSTVRTPVLVTILGPLPAPVVTVSATTISSVTFIWAPVTGATGYQISIDNGQHFITPSSGADGLTHIVNNLQPNQSVTIIVRASGSSDCQLSANSAAVTGTATNPFGNGIFVPNVFTPNGDGNNDILLVYGTTIKSLKLSIYDQWGELQFQTTNKATGWDGTYKGTKQPVGVYVYYVEVTTNDGQLIKKKGTVTLLR